ncbi:Hypothetical protein, putative [Bodo saltans]|uniref:Uncharacterized protein n=1 Tax=Bodo saltans TaxID=75058 RepID=A0A0S4JD48_BODSA|nr:Hypothetical protein, putative [Bodo saltans]|eukprot:CUG87433.1 Hypothetical protein, putative [Bodo saltans]
MSLRQQHKHQDVRSRPSAFQLSKLSLEDIVALSLEGTARLGGVVTAASGTTHVIAGEGNGGASPTHLDTNPTHHRRRSPQKGHHIALRGDEGSRSHHHKQQQQQGERQEKRQDRGHTSGSSPSKEISFTPPPSRHYVLQLETALSSADERHEAICRVLYDSVVRNQCLEVQVEEETLRRALQTQADQDTNRILYGMTLSSCSAAAAMSRKLVASQQDRASLMTSSNAIVSTTAQAYVLNDLRKLLEEQHTASHKAMGLLDTRLTTMIETHATTLHMAIAQSKESVASIQHPLEGQLKQLTAVLGQMKDNLCGSLEEENALRRVCDADVKDSILQLSLTLGEMSGRLRSADERTKELEAVAADQRKLLFEDLARRAAVDERRWDEHRTATEALLQRIQSSSHESIQSTMTSSRQHLVASLEPIHGAIAAVKDVVVEGQSAALQRQEEQHREQLQQVMQQVPSVTAQHVQGALSHNFHSIENLLAEVLLQQKAQVAAHQESRATVVLPPPTNAVGPIIGSLAGYLDAWLVCSMNFVSTVTEPFVQLASSRGVTMSQAVSTAASHCASQGELERQLLAVRQEMIQLRARLAETEAKEQAKIAMYDAVAQPFIPNQGVRSGVVYVAPQPKESLYRACGLVEAPAASSHVVPAVASHTSLGGSTNNHSASASGPFTSQHSIHQHGTTTTGNTTPHHHHNINDHVEVPGEVSVRRRVSRDLIVPFSTVSVDAASTAHDDGDDRTTMTTATDGNGEGRCTVDPSPLSPNTGAPAAATREEEEDSGRRRHDHHGQGLVEAHMMVLSSEGSEQSQSPSATAAPTIDFAFGGRMSPTTAATPGPALQSPPPPVVYSSPGPLASSMEAVASHHPAREPTTQRPPSPRHRPPRSPSLSLDDASEDVSLTSLDDDGGDDEDVAPSRAALAGAVPRTAPATSVVATSKLLNSFDADDDDDAKDPPVVQPAVSPAHPPASAPAHPAKKDEVNIDMLAPSRHSTPARGPSLDVPARAASLQQQPSAVVTPRAAVDDPLLSLKPGKGKKSLPTW